jgi:hypothetical protein
MKEDILLLEKTRQYLAAINEFSSQVSEEFSPIINSIRGKCEQLAAKIDEGQEVVGSIDIEIDPELLKEEKKHGSKLSPDDEIIKKASYDISSNFLRPNPLETPQMTDRRIRGYLVELINSIRSK